jgi:hypothetical protein
MNFITRSLPPDDRDEPHAEVPEPERTAPVELPEPPEVEHCSHCGEWHPVEPPCPSKVWDLQVDCAVTLLAELRRRGAVVTLREDGSTVNIKGYRPDPDTVEALKGVKDPLVAILKAGAKQ